MKYILFASIALLKMIFDWWFVTVMWSYIVVPLFGVEDINLVQGAAIVLILEYRNLVTHTSADKLGDESELELLIDNVLKWVVGTSLIFICCIIIYEMNKSLL